MEANILDLGFRVVLSIMGPLWLYIFGIVERIMEATI